MERIDHITVRAQDIVELGNQQMLKPNNEVGGAIVGTTEGTRLMVDRIIPMGTGSSPNSHTFDIDERLAQTTMAKVRQTGKKFHGIAHTHGPQVDLRVPSSPDRTASNNYDICLLIKVDSNGGGRFEFFDGQRRNIPFTVIGLDRKSYHSWTALNSAPDSCWKMAA